MNTDAVVRILLVDDDPRAAHRVHTCLGSAEDLRFVLVHVGLVVDAVAELSRSSFDMVLLDPALPDAAGTVAFIRLHAAAPQVPILVLADREDEFAALKAVHAGAVDYIFKDQLTPTLLSRAVRYAIERTRSREALRKAAEENERLAAAIASLATGVVITDPNAPDNPVVFANPAFLRMTGYDAGEVIGRNLRFLQGPDTDPLVVAEVRQAVAAGRSCEVVLLNYRKDGTPFWNQLTINPVHNDAGVLTHFIGLQTDVTDRIAAEDALARRNRELAALHRISTISLAPTPPEAGYRAMVAEIAAAAGFPVVVIALYDETIRCLVYQATYGFELPDPLLVPLDLAASGPAVRQRKYFVSHPDDASAISDPVLAPLGLRTLACFPMVADGRVIGTITLGHTEIVRTSERLPRFAASVASLVASFVERTRVQEALAAEGERLLVTLRSIADGVVATDTEGRITLLNPVAERLCGREQADAIGRPLSEVFRLLDEAGREALDPIVRLQEVDRTSKAVSERGILRSADGTERVVAHTAAPLRDRDGTTIGAVFVFRDITREQELERELRQASKLESLGILAGGIAHEFNNLLTRILGQLSLVRSDPDGARNDEALADIEHAARQARELTQQLLTFSGGGAPIRKRTALGEVLREIARAAFHAPGFYCDLEIADDLPPVEIDRGQINQAIGNILGNAMQAMPDGGTVYIACDVVALNAESTDARALPPGDYVRITIRDEGEGIAPENLPRIFDPFFTTRPNASGLGLSAAYSIVRRHGGLITARSTPGEGATFEILLPIAKDEAEPPPADPAARLSGRILVMDDDVSVLAVVRRMLERIGYEVRTAQDGESAIALYREAMEARQPFDAVIMDLTVPEGMGGREAVRHILEMDPDARVIVSSGYSSDPVMAEYRTHGFRGVIAKPYDLAELRRVVAEVIAP